MAAEAAVEICEGNKEGESVQIWVRERCCAWAAAGGSGFGGEE